MSFLGAQEEESSLEQELVSTFLLNELQKIKNFACTDTFGKGVYPAHQAEWGELCASILWCLFFICFIMYPLWYSSSVWVFPVLNRLGEFQSCRGLSRGLLQHVPVTVLQV